MSTLTVSLGNTSLFCGVFSHGRLTRSFRLSPAELPRLRARAGAAIDQAALCSVVPALTRDVARLIEHTWATQPRQLDGRAPLPFKIGYRNPHELGADRIAAALGAWSLYPKQNLIVVDCGTATTVTALTKRGLLAGGAIFPGVTLWTEMLASRTAQLPQISLREPKTALGRSTHDGIQSGTFHGHAGAIRELVQGIAREAFGRGRFTVIGTGGHSPLFARARVFSRMEPALVLRGLYQFARQTA